MRYGETWPAPQPGGGPAVTCHTERSTSLGPHAWITLQVPDGCHLCAPCQGRGCPACQSSGIVPDHRPARDRHTRVLAYEARRADRAPRSMPWAAPRSTQAAPGGSR